MQEGNKGAAGRCWRGDPEYIEGKVSCIVDERCRTRVCEKHFIDPVLYLFLLLLLVFSKKTNNKRKQSKKSSPQQHTHIHAMHKISTVDFCFFFFYFRRSISSRLFSTLFSSGNNPHLGFFLCVCLSFLFSFHHVVGVPYLFFYKHTEED